MNELAKNIAMGQIRSLVIAVGASAVAHGYITDAGVNQAAGAVVMLLGFVWSGVDKYLAEQKAKERVAVAVAAAPSGS